MKITPIKETDTSINEIVDDIIDSPVQVQFPKCVVAETGKIFSSQSLQSLNQNLNTSFDKNDIIFKTNKVKSSDDVDVIENFQLISSLAINLVSSDNEFDHDQEDDADKSTIRSRKSSNCGLNGELISNPINDEEKKEMALLEKSDQYLANNLANSDHYGYSNSSPLKPSSLQLTEHENEKNTSEPSTLSDVSHSFFLVFYFGFNCKKKYLILLKIN